jgi:Holliday junction resolvasome RuvABC endonuclease subunit
MILGVDVSTKCIGWCILENDGSFKDVGYIWLKDLDYPEKLNKLWATLRPKMQSDMLYEDWQVFVEAPLQRSNNQNVVNILQHWNGMVCAYLYKLSSGVFPTMITEHNVRKINDIKVPKGVKGVNKKKYVLQCVQELGIIPEDKWEYKKTGNPKDFCYDMADAYLVAKAGFLQ